MIISCVVGEEMVTILQEASVAGSSCKLLYRPLSTAALGCPSCTHWEVWNRGRVWPLVLLTCLWMCQAFCPVSVGSRPRSQSTRKP